MQFRANQRVKCINPNTGLKLGKIYTVEFTEGNFVYLEGVSGGRVASRFEPFDDLGRKLIISVLERQRDTTNSMQEQQDAIKALEELEKIYG